MRDLAQLAEFYMTDKRAAEHNYVQFYENYLSRYKNSQINLVEIGILEHPNKSDRPFGAASLRLWADYFPNGVINGIDISDLKHLQDDRIHIHVGDQENPETLKNIFMHNNVRPNIIIDDGSHRSRHQQTSLFELFNYLQPGGLYVIEDIAHFELKKESRNEIEPAKRYPDLNNLPVVFTSINTFDRYLFNSTLTVLMRYCVSLKIDSFFSTSDQRQYLEENIEFCNIHRSNIFDKYIAFIQKK